MRLLFMSNVIYERYKQSVRGAEDISIEEARRLMTRNMLLSIRGEKGVCKGTYYMYGRLHFVVDNNRIVWLKNRMPAPKSWKRNNRRYLKLNERFGIDSEISELGLLVRDTYLDEPREFNGIEWKIGNETIVGEKWIY